MNNDSAREDPPGWVDSLWSTIRNDFSKHGSFPVQRNVQREVDVLVASELNQMDFKDRERAYEELHGIVGDDFDETPEKIQYLLWQLEGELQRIPHKDAYDVALNMNRDYLEDENFRLMFLRADRYDPAMAAARLVLFMEKKRKFFGADSLVRSLTLNDLDEDDMETLRMGQQQLLPVRDRSGRLVLIDSTPTGPKRFTTQISIVSEGFVGSVLAKSKGSCLILPLFWL